MGSEQSHQSVVQPIIKSVRPASTSPRPSIGSDTDIPYISYTINKPIGESPKLQPKHSHHLRSTSSSPAPSPKIQRPLSSSSGHNIVVVKEANVQEHTVENDPEVCKLQTIPMFLPIMRGALNVPTMKDPEILDKLDYKVIYELCARYEEHLKLSAEAVSTDQNALAARMREIDFVINRLVGMMTERQKKFVKYAEKLSKVQEVSNTLKHCQQSLDQCIEKLELLNAYIPEEDQLEPFVWTTG
ncbi:hypothetical protein CHUAL_013606 [Chamberlinius hualienensis]